MDANAADPSPARVTVEAALDAFIARKQGQRLSHSCLYKFSLMQRELVNFARCRGLTLCRLTWSSFCARCRTATRGTSSGQEVDYIIAPATAGTPVRSGSSSGQDLTRGPIRTCSATPLPSNYCWQAFPSIKCPFCWDTPA
jgi:hypothetical protein